MGSDLSNLEPAAVEPASLEAVPSGASLDESGRNDGQGEGVVADVAPTEPADVLPQGPMAGGVILPGSMLSGNLESLFAPGTADESQIRAVGYDLRIGNRFMIVPEGRSISRLAKQYPRGCTEVCGKFTLKPGEAAFSIYC